MRKLSMTSGRDAKLRLHTDVNIQCHQRYCMARTLLYHIFTERPYDLDGTVACMLAAASALHGSHAHAHTYTQWGPCAAHMQRAI